MRVLVVLLVFAALFCVVAWSKPLKYGKNADLTALATLRQAMERRRQSDLDTCLAVECVDDGDSCDSDYEDCIEENSGHLCERICPFPTVCRPDIEDRQSKRCVRSMWGRKCEENSDCLGVGVDPGLSCSSHYLRCLIDHEYVGQPNDFCNEDADCTDKCVQGRCTALPEGGACNSIDDCNAGLYCNKSDSNPGTCTPKDATNKCDSGNDACPELYICNTTSEACVELHSIEVGGDCFDDELCGDDLWCETTEGKCREINVTNEGQACVPGSSLGNETCSVALSDCTCNTDSGEYTCFAGIDVPNLCYPEVEAYFTCLSDNSCHKDSSFNEPEACAYEYCFEQAIAYLNCEFETRYWSHVSLESSCWVRYSERRPDPSPASTLTSWVNFF